MSSQNTATRSPLLLRAEEAALGQDRVKQGLDLGSVDKVEIIFNFSWAMTL